MWYIIRTEPKKERSVRHALRRQGNAVYVPANVYRARVRSLPFRPLAWAPILPGGYMFVECENAAVLNLWMRQVLDTKHVNGFIGVNGVASPLSAETVAELRRKIDEYKTAARVLREAAKLRKGGEAKIMSGPLSGKRGTVTYLRGKKAKILAWVLDGKLREVEVKTSNLEAA